MEYSEGVNIISQTYCRIREAITRGHERRTAGIRRKAGVVCRDVAPLAIQLDKSNASRKLKKKQRLGIRRGSFPDLPLLDDASYKNRCRRSKP